MFGLTGQTPYIDDAISARGAARARPRKPPSPRAARPRSPATRISKSAWYIEQLALAYDYGYARLTDAAARSAGRTTPIRRSSTCGIRRWPRGAACRTRGPAGRSAIRATTITTASCARRCCGRWRRRTRPGSTSCRRRSSARSIDYFARAPRRRLARRHRLRHGAEEPVRELHLLEGVHRRGPGRPDRPYARHDRLLGPRHGADARSLRADRRSIALVDPELYDYHENLVHAAVVLSGGHALRRARGTWWLQNNSVERRRPELQPHRRPAAVSGRARRADRSRLPRQRAPAHFFARSSWDTDAAWLSFVAGKYDQSHAHHDQGSFTFFKGDWLAVTSNIWSHSGINLDVDVHNVIRFERDGAAIEQNPSTTRAIEHDLHRRARAW